MSKATDGRLEEWAQHIYDLASSLDYGSVNVTFHDGKIVQIEKTERSRFDSEISLRPVGYVRDKCE